MSAVTVLPLAPLLAEMLTLLAASLLIAAAGFDILTRLIPNFIPLALAVLGLVRRLADGSWPRALLGACALLVPPVAVFPMVTAVGMAGGVLAFIYLVARRVVSRPRPVPTAQRPQSFLGRALRAERWRLARGTALPYAVAIAIGSLTAFP